MRSIIKPHRHYMNFRHTTKTAFIGIKTNRSRSALTILGIVIGITAIMLVMSVGSGAEQLILNEVKSFGGETIVIEPGREPKGPSDFIEFLTDSLKPRDVEALKKPANVRGLKDIEPAVVLPATISYGNETKRATVRGGADIFIKMMDLKISKGEFYTNDDIKEMASVAVIGAKVKEELFGQNDAIGKKIKIKNRTFKVVGTLVGRGSGGFMDVDTLVMAPYTTVQKYLLGIDHYHAIIARAENELIVPQVTRDIKSTLRETHSITDPEKDDFHVTTQEDIVKRIGSISTILSVLLVSIAAISLVVGGIGIMNIMLVSVTERTQEIGLRKAIGATDKDILKQFLFEAIMLTAAGGIVGISLGALLSFISSIILTRFVGLAWHFTFPLGAAFLGLGVSAFIGLVFGLYPARKASQKTPIEALRYE